MRQGSPLEQAVLQTIRSRIFDGTFPSGTSLPSERELSDHHAVSRTIVRRALDLLASEGLIKVQRGCRPVVTEGFREIRNTRHKLIDVGIWLWPDAENYGASSILKGIQRAAPQNRMRFMIGSVSEYRPEWDRCVAREAQFIREVMNDQHACGMILWCVGGERSFEVLKAAQRSGLHLVFVDRLPPKGIDADFVGTANRSGAAKAVRHLLDLGHRDIACIPNMDVASSVGERLAGYVEAIRDQEVQPKIVQLVLKKGESDESAFKRLARDVVSSKVTAVFAINDTIALGLVNSLRQIGVRVPEDISVVGFDGMLRWLPHGGPLTTVDQDFYRIGEVACELLLERIAGEEPSAVRHVYLDAPLAQLGTSAVARSTIPESSPAEILSHEIR
jgi:DNA-binding LacI/PurR family transcriptional regulator